MFTLTELSAAVRARRSDMGLTQGTLAKRSGLSRATVNQVENGTIQDLSINRAAKLLAALGLSMTISPPRLNRGGPAIQKRDALEIAALTASVSYRSTMTADQLRDALATGVVTGNFVPHVNALLEEAPISLLASVVEQLHLECGLERPQVWRQMREMARHLKSNRELWQ